MPEPVQALESIKPLQNTPIPIGAVAFQHLASRPDHEVFSVSLRNIEHALKPKIKTDPATVLPEVYKEFLRVFSHEKANKLPPAQPEVNHIIIMQPATQPPAGPLYGMSKDELEVFKKYLEDNLSKDMSVLLLFLLQHLFCLSRSQEEASSFAWTTVASMTSQSRTNTPCH